jgi:hypothetical protein
MVRRRKHWKKSVATAKMPNRRGDIGVEVGRGREMIGDGEGTDQQTGTLRRGGNLGRHPEIGGGQARTDVELLLETGRTTEMMTHIRTEITANIGNGVEMLLARTGERDSGTEIHHAPVHRGEILLDRFAGKDDQDRPIDSIAIPF